MTFRATSTSVFTDDTVPDFGTDPIVSWFGVATSWDAASLLLSNAPGHYTSNLKGVFAGAAAAGFNLMDVTSKAVMDILPAGTRGVYWIGNYDNVTCSFTLTDSDVTTIVQNNMNDPKFSGIYYIADEPHHDMCPNSPAQLAARSALVHSIDPYAKTMLLVQDGSSHPGEFQAFASCSDYVGVDPYPCNVNNAVAGFNPADLTSRIDGALAYNAASKIVPVFQTFGQANITLYAPFYRMPTPTELSAMLALWDARVHPADRRFDFSYSWGNQAVIRYL